jgi:hypothetical protein
VMKQRRELAHAKRHSCFREAPEVDHMLGLARAIKKQFPLPDIKDPKAVLDHKDKVFAWAKERFFVGVQSHEFGHSVGLRHNFAGTFDALNFGEEYWQLRTSKGAVTKACAAGNQNGADCVGPRWNDPLTEDEINGNIGSFASSTVMDYPGDASVDMLLLGKYDRAAVRFGYAGVVDVWADAGLSVKGQGEGKRKAYEMIGLASQPGLFGVSSLPKSEPDASGRSTFLHYSQYGSEFRLVHDCGAGDSATGVKCKQPKLDVVDYRDMESFVEDPKFPEFSTTSKATDASGRPRHGYLFSSDEYADSGNVPSFRNDAGADPYEQARFLESAFENRYIFDNFRRNRSTFNSYGVVSRNQARYLDQLQAMSKTFGYAMVLEGPDPSAPDPKLLADGNYGPLSLAASLAFDLYTRSLLRPEPGKYCSPEKDDCYAVQPPGLNDWIFGADTAPSADIKYNFSIPLGQGRFVHNDFDYSQGYNWGDYQKQVGSFYDKAYAFYYIAEAYDTFIANSKEDFIDGRYKNINFATIYPNQVRRLFAQLMTGDASTYAPWSTKSAVDAPIADLTYPNFRGDVAPARPASANLIDPSFGFNEQLYAMVWGTVLFPTSYGQDFINDARIVANQAEQLSWPVAQTYTFVNPETGITYRARTAGKEKVFNVDHEKAIGARMLEWANQLVESTYVVDTDADGNTLKNTDGTPKLKLKNGQPQLAPDGLGSPLALKRYVTNIEIMRQLVKTFDGPFSALPN